jgi:hypothetical protein
MVRQRSFAVIFVLAAAAAVAHSQVAEPVLKWQGGGCYASWCETGWYASPAIVDVDGDGIAEVVASAYSIVALEGADGTLIWRAASGHDVLEPGASNVGRTWPGIAVADVDGDGALEIVTAHGGGWVSVYTLAGVFEPGWPVQPPTAAGPPLGSELRSLSLGDLDRDGTFEILVGAARGSNENAWVLEHSGGVRAGWPQVDAGGGGYAWGVYGSTTAIADLDGDLDLELLVPSDVHYACAYQPDGAHIPASATFGSRNWGEVGLWVDATPELRGWGSCDGTPVESWRTNMAEGPATVADLDGDGTTEIVLTGRTYDCSGGTETTLFAGVYILRHDRTRWSGPGGDWTTVPTGTGAPLSMDYNVIESAQPAPAVADLDGDGVLEILYSDFSGRVHAFWLDGSEHGQWPVSVHDLGAGFLRFASEPAAADLDHDGAAEILVATWTEKGSDADGTLLVIDGDGTVLQSVAIPLGPGSPSWGGALAAPSLGDIDGDADLEVVLQTSRAGVVAYDLPGSGGARLDWRTGRGSLLRAGTPDPALFADGFERGSTASWSQVVGAD